MDLHYENQARPELDKLIVILKRLKSAAKVAHFVSTIDTFRIPQVMFH